MKLRGHDETHNVIAQVRSAWFGGGPTHALLGPGERFLNLGKAHFCKIREFAIDVVIKWTIQRHPTIFPYVDVRRRA